MKSQTTPVHEFKIRFKNSSRRSIFRKYFFLLKAISVIIRSFTNTIGRFPVPILAGVLSFVFLLIELHWGSHNIALVNDYRYVKLFLECMSAISLFIAFDIFSESQQLKKSTRFGLYLLGFCILGMHYYSITPGMFDSESIFISRYLIFLVCFHLMISFLAFHSSDTIQSFWQYNYFLLKRIVTSLLYSTSLLVGLASALLAVDKLFEIHFNPDYYTDLTAFIFLVFNTIFFLKGIPASYESFSVATEFKKSVRIFVQYVLLPILGIYTIILYLYMIKILMNHQLPNGWVCIPILIYSITGILAYLLIYPIRLNEVHRLIYLFSKYFFYLLLPLLSLYFIGIVKRIMPYGITEDRYLVFILGIWIVIISIYIITSKKDNIIVVPVSLFILMAVSAIGPWGMFQLSVQNQMVRLEHLLKRNHLLENGKLVKLKKKYKVSKQDASSIRSIFSYLNKRGEINQIHTWLGEDDQHKLDSAISKSDLVYVNSIFADLGPEESSPYELRHFFVADKNNIDINALQIEGYHHLSKFNCSIDNNTPVRPDSMHPIAYHLVHDTLKLSSLHQPELSIPLTEKFNAILQYHHQQDSLNMKKANAQSKLMIVNESTQTIRIPEDTMTLIIGKSKLLFNKIEFTQSDTTYVLRSVEGYLMD